MNNKAKQNTFLKLKDNQLTCLGDWDLENFVAIENELKTFTAPTSGELTVDGGSIKKMDTAGAWLLHHWRKKLEKKGLKINPQNFSKQQQELLTLISKDEISNTKIPTSKKPNWLANLGQHTEQLVIEFRNYLAFVGQITFYALYIIKHPSHIRWKSIVATVYSSGYQALPIIAVLSLMIGIVMAYLMGLQLKNYGANIYIVDLLGYSILREFGPLITAIMVIGRTGSAFTAQLGTMKVNQEIDALNTMGLPPIELLILPRMIGVLIALPLLTVWANIFGVIGGMLMAESSLDIGWHDFLFQFEQRVPVRALIIGLCKAPVFALIIGSIGCFEGMLVKGSADSVGKQTTRSVVLAIFFVMVADAIFSITLSHYKL